MDGPSLERLHELVPAALEEDLLAEVRAEAREAELDVLRRDWQRDRVPWLTVQASDPLDEPPPEDREPPPMTAGQVIGLLEHRLGAVPLQVADVQPVGDYGQAVPLPPDGPR